MIVLGFVLMFLPFDIPINETLPETISDLHQL